VNKYFNQDDHWGIFMEIDMENTNAAMEKMTSQKLRCTWQRTTEFCADLTLEPGVSLEQLRTAINVGKVFVDEDGDWGEKGYLYCFGGSCSEIILARILKLYPDSTDDPNSFVLSPGPTQATELTKEQLDRQDFVEGVIHAALEELADRELEHDMSLIAEVRDVISAEFAERGIMTEMDFYPFFEC
jgi:hypothetical protein